MLKPYESAQISFTKDREIGQEGRNSKVFLVRDHQLDADLVVKEIPKSDIRDSSAYFSEARLLYAGRHHNVVPIHYACQNEECIFIAMPFYATGSVKQLMSGRYLTVREIIRLATQFLTGLHNIHSKGLIHFDIKPDNILLSDSYEAMLSDFGLARRMDSFGVAENSRNYMKQRPPEAFTGDNQFTRAFDIYQVGMALYRMCNGDDWFNTQLNSYFIDERFDRQRFCNDVLSGSFPNRSKFLHHIPDSLRNVVKRCLQVQPEERYRSVIELLNDLAKIDCNELDWQFERNNNERRWILRDDNRVISLTVDASNNSVASKITAKRNNRITNYCLTPITDHKIRAFLRQRH